MTSLKDRAVAFEAKYAHDAEMQFKAEARANRALALWAAGLMGRDPDEAEAYVREVIRADFIEAGSEDVVAKVAGDMGTLADAARVRAKLAECLTEAKAALSPET